jgi:hypothetical protein
MEELQSQERDRIALDAWGKCARAVCPYSDPDDASCQHPRNLTPECHEGACPPYQEQARR